jgi:adenylate cyclase
MLDEPDNVASANTGDGPAESEVRAQLERILASRCFEQAQRASRFLRFAVEQTLAGHGDRLKGYTIAVEAFDRPPDFDAQSDPLVRVEAGRLRRRLIEYYATEGQHDAVRIELPRGGYAVTWSYAPREERAVPADGVSIAAPPVGHARPRGRWRRIRSLVVVGVMLTVLAIVVRQQYEVSRLTSAYPTFAEALAQGRPPIVVVPFEDLTEDARTRSLAQTLTEEVRVRLDEHGLFAVAAEPRIGAVDPAVVAAASDSGLGAGYVLSGSVRYTPDAIRITARLVLAETGTQLWSAVYDESLAVEAVPAEQERIGRTIAAVAAPYGPVFEAELARITAAPHERLGTAHCMLEYYAYRRDFAAALHAEALACFARVTRAEPRLADAWAGLAMVLIDAYAYGFEGDESGEAAALDRAREAARRAMDIDGDNLFGNLALARVQFFSGADFRPTAEQALALRPNNAEALSLVGTMYALTGDLTRGRELIDRAIALSPRPPGNYYAGKALAHIGSREYDEALAAALRIDAPNWLMGHTIVASAAALAGRADIAAREGQRLRELSTVSGQNAATAQRWPIDEALRAEFNRGFAVAQAAAAQ